MNDNVFTVYLNNKEIKSIEEFYNFKPSVSNFKKDGLFVRFIGIENEKDYFNSINNMDNSLIKLVKDFKIGYLRLKSLNISFSSDEFSVLESHYNNIISSYSDKSIKYNFNLPFNFENISWNNLFKKEFINTIDVFCKTNINFSTTILKNFIIKLLFWTKIYFPKLFLKTKVLSNFPKFVFYGNIKLQEYLFLQLISSIGCDTIILNPKNDIENINTKILEKSCLFYSSNLSEIVVPDINDLKSNKNTNKEKIIKDNISNPVSENIRVTHSKTKELEYIQLAKLSSSVVKIYVYNKKNEVFSTGSGVFINKKGHILTNFHVIFDGSYYGIQLEDTEELVFTNEVTKYHSQNDLALLKLDIESFPIPLFIENYELVRGQKIVTIGSPLGLFNTISDGIISGFRVFDDRNMIQISAPISSGSSGGALIDLYGNLIGITTAGMDEGQNLNLAISHKDIYHFISGFLTEKFIN